MEKEKNEKIKKKRKKDESKEKIILFNINNKIQSFLI